MKQTLEHVKIMQNRTQTVWHCGNSTHWSCAEPSFAENKVAENGVLVGFNLIGEALRMISFTWSLLLLRFDSISFDFTL